MQSENPKEYWKIIKEGKTSETHHNISLDIFKEHFEKLALGNESGDACETNGELNNIPPDEILNRPFTPQEGVEAISKLKNNKSGGSDQIINEFLKHSRHEFAPCYTRIFNLILESGHMPDDWCQSVIRSIYKNKGDPDDPNNYRGISLLGCFGKLFTSCSNRRLTIFIENNNIVQAEQAGLKSDFSTIDHLFVLKSLADLYLSKRKRLYCCFVDYKKAFDTINRSTLWSKMLASGILGKLFDIIKNMYEKAKSSVALTAEKQSDFFTCNIGVRQGENLSPLLFSIYLHDLKSFISQKCNGLKDIENLQKEHLHEEIVTFFKLYILLYADDKVILAENPNDHHWMK